ncbi:MAG: flippase activity-associated protein Agl23 [Chloroflexota bacterium]
MATIEQVPPMLSPAPEPSDAEPIINPLNSLLARAYTLNWEMIFYITLFIVTILTRFVNLGDRVMSHDESLHVKYSYDLYKSGNFQHTPLMHGPVLFHMTALMYFLFGDSDFSARLYPAILGTMMVFFPKLLFERWLGKLGSIVATVLLLISPMVLYHNRYIREDTPSIFFTLLMVYAIFAYIDGARPRKLQWLVLLSGAMLLSLASKEVAFMYIAIFGAVLTLFWLIQVAQGIRSGDTHPIVGNVLGGVLGVAAIGLLSVVLGNSIGALLNANGIAISPRIVVVVVAIVLAAITLVLLGFIRAILGQVGQHANSVFKLVMAGIILGTVGALGGTVILSIIQPSAAATDSTLLARQISWGVLLAVPLLLVIVGTALIRFTRSTWLAVAITVVVFLLALLFIVDLPLVSRLLLAVAMIGALWLLGSFVRRDGPAHIPWGDIFTVALVAGLICAFLVFAEERSRNVPNVSSDKGTSVTSGYHDEWIIGSWIVGLVVIGGIAFLRFGTPFFEEMKRYPVFDVLMVMGTLVLPWAAALPIFLAGYPLDGSYTSPDVIAACVKGVIPFVAVSIAAGLAWNPVAWLTCTAVFYSIFAFFYTTIFTNVTGIATGLVGSLGYWLAQQGVRRGSQPQYYYLLVELPIYEYLPVIGASVAGVVGMLGLWRVRREQIEQGIAAAELAAASSLEQPLDSDEMVETSDTIDGVVNDTINPNDSEDVLDPMPDTMVASATSVIEVPQIDGIYIPRGEPVDDSDLAPIQGDVAESTMELIGDEEPLVSKPKRHLHTIAEGEWLDRLPFLPFVGFWAVLIIMAFTIAGEKMPWLTTHLTIPLIFLTGWYLGTLLEKVEWPAFSKQGWALIILTPILVIALANVAAPFAFNNSPFGTLQREDLLKTFTWLGAVLLAGLVGYGLFRIWRRVGTSQAIRITILGVFVLLGILTARIAWMAAFINYDSAREFMVYAHGAPASKSIMGQIEEISKRTTDGMNIKVAYDNEISWPGTWYFRNYSSATFLGDNPSAATNLDSNLVIVIGNNNNAKVEPLLTDKYYKTKLIRLWWPMQEYFDLNKDRIDNVFSGDSNLPAGWVSGSALRQGLWEIWWDRDYTAFGQALNKPKGFYAESQWPVADWLYLYVRKDVAAQVWDFGTGGIKVSTDIPDDPFNQLRCDACQSNLVFSGKDITTGGELNRPRAVAVGPDGNLYVADSQNARIVIFDADGKYLRQFGTAGSIDQGATGGMLREPWGVAVGQDGTIYVADTWNHRVQIFDKDGKFVRMWGQFEQVAVNTTGKPDSFWGPRGIAVDSDNNVYIADTGNKRIRVYDQQGTFKFNIGGDILNEPVGLAINSETHELFVADTWNKRIQVFGLDGTALRSWNVQAWGPTTESGNRPYITLDKTGTILFATDPDAGRMLAFTTQGKPLVSTTKQGAILSGIAVDKAGRIFVADSAASTVLRYAEEDLPGMAAPAPVVGQGQQAPELATEAATKDDF